MTIAKGCYGVLEMIMKIVNTVNLICKQSEVAQDGQKEYADSHRRFLEFHIREVMFMKISPFISVIQFSTQGKLNPIFTSPFNVIDRVRKVPY